MRLCSISKCTNKRIGRGYCRHHYDSWRRHGNPLAFKQSFIRRKHGQNGSPTYRTWAGMIQRCNNPNSTKYNHYGGRGITVCDEWQDFEGFYKDMGDRPDNLTLDRIDNEKGYSLENCRWATNTEQRNNQRPSNSQKVWYRNDNRYKKKWLYAFQYRGKTYTKHFFTREEAVEAKMKLKKSLYRTS